MTVGLGSGIYGVGNYVVGYILTEKEATLVLPPDHREALRRGDAAAIEREARSRLEGNKSTNYSLPWSDKLRLEEKITDAIWDATDTPGDRERAFSGAVFEPLKWGGVALAAGLVAYFLVWALRWLVTGRATTIFGWLRR
jgi:hypothetical protein